MQRGGGRRCGAAAGRDAAAGGDAARRSDGSLPSISRRKQRRSPPPAPILSQKTTPSAIAAHRSPPRRRASALPLSGRRPNIRSPPSPICSIPSRFPTLTSAAPQVTVAHGALASQVVVAPPPPGPHRPSPTAPPHHPRISVRIASLSTRPSHIPALCGSVSPPSPHLPHILVLFTAAALQVAVNPPPFSLHRRVPFAAHIRRWSEHHRQNDVFNHPPSTAVASVPRLAAFASRCRSAAIQCSLPSPTASPLSPSSPSPSLTSPLRRMQQLH
ncbi:hypothetical protein DAI22_02g147550 [Oryza sativa Japonica Group]|nr:hypothetical protein DAI22_02g147550 [Oryza sativa Japonica Group]